MWFSPSLLKIGGRAPDVVLPIDDGGRVHDVVLTFSIEN
jgi:hypothetical protein